MSVPSFFSKFKMNIPAVFSKMSWKSPIKAQYMRILAELVVVLYLLTLFAKINYYGSLKNDQLFSTDGLVPFFRGEQAPSIDTTGKAVGYSTAPNDAPMVGNVNHKLNIFLVNTPNYHYEVFLPVIDSFKRIKNANITLISTDGGMSKWGIRNAMDIARGEIPIVTTETVRPSQIGAVPDVVFLTTCPEDMRQLGASLDAFLIAGAHVVCIVHQAHLWDVDNVAQYTDEIALMKPWIDRGQWHFAALSRHVHTFIRVNFPKYLNTPDHVYRPLLFHPVFEYSAPENLDFNSNPFAVIPGKFESERRNYAAVFNEYNRLNCDINLRLVGSGKIPEFSENLQSKIGFVTNLNFYEFFQEMSKGVAIIPTLGSEFYLKSQASSTVATSLIAGTPLIASRKFMSAHSQIPMEAIWLQGEDETELEVLQRIGGLDPTVWKEKKDLVKNLRNNMIRDNVDRISHMLNTIATKYEKGYKRPSHAF
ncbi:uncharacterized protein V1510DRAFT_202196 [Dipodascopsis tothii]|uniref:uncharacterized protein n=1 Tax=Dipodascopsis tothii TaxID=44089 RepID=UPI0034CEB0D8